MLFRVVTEDEAQRHIEINVSAALLFVYRFTRKILLARGENTLSLIYEAVNKTYRHGNVYVASQAIAICITLIEREKRMVQFVTPFLL